ncbi:MAG: YfiR family protein [Bacteroidales bacterium]
METKKNFTHRLLKVLTLLVILTVSINANAQKERLQTAFIYQLTRLIEWCPEGKQGSFVIAVLGSEQGLITELQALNGRSVGSQKIEIKSFSSVSDISSTNILFVPDSQFDNVRQITNNLKGGCTLIVSDRSGAAGLGAGVSLVFNQSASKLEFEINRGYMRRNSLNVNDQLYNLASKVY